MHAFWWLVPYNFLVQFTVQKGKKKLCRVSVTTPDCYLPSN